MLSEEMARHPWAAQHSLSAFHLHFCPIPELVKPISGFLFPEQFLSDKKCQLTQDITIKDTLPFLSAFPQTAGQDTQSSLAIVPCPCFLTGCGNGPQNCSPC